MHEKISTTPDSRESKFSHQEELSLEEKIQKLEERLREKDEKNIGLKEKLEKSEEENKVLKEKFEKSEGENKNKDELFSVFAHDLRSPFQTLLGFSEYLMENLKNMTDEEKAEIAEKLNVASEQTFNLTHSMLLWGKTQLGAFEAMNDDINLSDQLTKIITSKQREIDDKKIELINNISKNTIVHADINMLHSVLSNIISNCIKFSHEGGEVLISMENNNVIIKDNGIGMLPEKINNFFDSIGDTNYGTKGEKGNGLGMSFSMKFMKLMGGNIRVESEGEGKGTTFIVTLPTAEKTS
jgi:signal transduction histidine kinase